MQHGTKGKDEKLYRFEHSDISRFRCSEVLRFSGIVEVQTGIGNGSVPKKCGV